jgi:hypothetical protein
VFVDGKRYQRHQEGEVEYYTLVGAIRVPAGMIHRASPASAYSIAHGYATGPIRHYEAQLHAAHRSLPPHATVERLARRVGGSAARDDALRRNRVSRRRPEMWNVVRPAPRRAEVERWTEIIERPRRGRPTL